MRRFFPIVTLVLMLCACSSQKSKVKDYLKKFYPDYEVVGEQVTEGNAFLPIDQLQSTCKELDDASVILYNLAMADPDVASRKAVEYKEKYGDVNALLYPTGKADRKTYTVKCVNDMEEERLVVFFQQKEGDDIEACSLDFIAYEDSIMSKQARLMSSVNILVSQDKTATSAAPVDKAEPEPAPEPVQEAAEEPKVEE